MFIEVGVKIVRVGRGQGEVFEVVMVIVGFEIVCQVELLYIFYIVRYCSLFEFQNSSESFVKLKGGLKRWVSL